MQDAGIELIMGIARNTAALRAGSSKLFFTAAVALSTFPTEEDVFRAAFKAMDDGWDSVYKARAPHC